MQKYGEAGCGNIYIMDSTVIIDCFYLNGIRDIVSIRNSTWDDPVGMIPFEYNRLFGRNRNGFAFFIHNIKTAFKRIHLSIQKCDYRLNQRISYLDFFYLSGSNSQLLNVFLQVMKIFFYILPPVTTFRKIKCIRAIRFDLHFLSIHVFCRFRTFFILKQLPYRLISFHNPFHIHNCFSIADPLWCQSDCFYRVCRNGKG